MRHHKLSASIKMVNRFFGFSGVFLRELKRLKSDGPQKILLFVITPLVCWLFCALYGNGTVQNLPIAICDNDNSALSRTISRSINATKLMDVISYVNNPLELEQGIQSGIYAAGLYLPPNMEADIKGGKQVQPVVYRNGTNLLVSSNVMRDVQTIFRTINAGLVRSRLIKSGMSFNRAMALVSPIGVDLSNLYNTVFSYQNFLSSGIIFAQLGLIVMLSGAICFAREKEHGSYGQLRHRSSGNAFFALHGKSLPYALLFVIIIVFLSYIIFPFYNVATPKETLSAFVAITLYLLASWWIGAFLGLLTGQVMLASAISVFIGMPAFIFSGWTFPLPAAPPLISYLAQILPFTHFMPAWFSSARMSMGIFSAHRELIILCCIVFTSYMLSNVLLRISWNKTRGVLIKQARNTDENESIQGEHHA